ncbi:Protoheme IX farnesyltransferase mitochondrial [Fasciola gigantica]|uniref:Protoheme IX farnesyltransferase, mitochondrial n=1 Tax=Fasciola gigantica TaxID=46835 RepID=A0A504Y5W6_FASGI|nr:Protoheme IX farnesyltransferase mitochondrial [Fasciola gigantica]
MSSFTARQCGSQCRFYWLQKYRHSCFCPRVKTKRLYCSQPLPRSHCYPTSVGVLKQDSAVEKTDSQDPLQNTPLVRNEPKSDPAPQINTRPEPMGSCIRPRGDKCATISDSIFTQVSQSCDSTDSTSRKKHGTTERIIHDTTQASSFSSSECDGSNFSVLSTELSHGARQLAVSVSATVASTRTQSSLAIAMQIAAGLSKARLSGLVVSTAIAGCALAAPTSLVTPEFLLHPYQTLICLAIGTGLTSAAANTINQIVEIPYDSQMIRTRNRVLVRGLTNPARAGLFALGCASFGLFTLYLGTNPLVIGLAVGNLLLYTSFYTPLKQISQANTWVGAWVGAVPPLMGWAATTGEVHSGALILASLLYVWQFPHFMALSWNLRHEYSRAGYMMTSVLDPDLCKRVAVRHAVAASLVCLAGAGCSAISLGPWAGCALGLACLPPNIGLIYYASQFARAPPGDGSSAAARRLFRATLIHLPVVMTAALIGTYFCAYAV